MSLTQGLVNLNRAAKNLRRPRNSLGRGLPKKGGARDKGTWRKLRDEVELPWVDPREGGCRSGTRDWGEQDHQAQRPVKYLVKKIVLMWREYLCSRDVQEATRCLKDLEVPHFNHELMYEAVVMMKKACRRRPTR